MTEEAIYNGSIGAGVAYGKNSAGALKALRTNDDGEIEVADLAATMEDINTRLAILIAGHEDQNTLLAMIAEELGA